MSENKKVIFVPHCLLNHNVRVNRRDKTTKDLIELFLDADVGIVQIPCPEVEFNGGLNRSIRSKKAYDTKNYRNYCRKLSLEILENVEKYLKAKYNVLGILGVEFSPTCAVHRIDNGKKIVPGKGILIEELETEMQKKNFQVPLIPTNLNNIFSTIENLDILLKNC